MAKRMFVHGHGCSGGRARELRSKFSRKTPSNFGIPIIELFFGRKKNLRNFAVPVVQACSTEGPWHAAGGPDGGIGVPIEVCPQNPIKFWHFNHRIVLWSKKKIWWCFAVPVHGQTDVRTWSRMFGRPGTGVAIEIFPQNPIKFWHSNHRILLWAKKNF